MSALRPSSIHYSQNFLKSRRLIDQLLDKCAIDPNDVIYEIGPGRGIITERLAQRCRQVIAIEKDLDLLSVLRPRLVMVDNIRLYGGDFLTYPLPNRPYKVFANIPFNITSAIVTRLTATSTPPDDSYLIMQKEAAQRFLGEPRETLYSILLKPCFELELLHHFRRSDFSPAPRVDVVMLRLRKRGPPLIALSEQALFRDFIIYCFTTPLPSLRSIFKSILPPAQFKFLVDTLRLSPDATPTTLHFTEWLTAFDCFQRNVRRETLSRIVGSEKRLRQQQATLEKIHRTRPMRRDTR